MVIVLNESVSVAVPTVTVGKGIISSRRTVAATAVDEVFEILIGKVIFFLFHIALFSLNHELEICSSSLTLDKA